MTNFLTTFAAGCSTGGGFFGIPTWYKYLVEAGLMTTDSSGTCSLITLSTGQWPQVVVLVAMAVLDILLRVAGLVAVIFIVYGGIRYITSDGDPSATKKAQETLVGAVIGLIIAVVAAALVSFIGKALTR